MVGFSKGDETMKAITILITGLILNSTAFATPEDGLMFHCTDESQAEFTIEYMYDDPEIIVSEEATLSGVKKTISWFHPYCGIGYTYKEQISITLKNQFFFISGGQNCEGESYTHSCTIEPIYSNKVYPAAGACCSWGTEENPIPGCWTGC